MKSKKIIISLCLLVIFLSISSAVYAARFSSYGLYFSKGKSYDVEGELGPNIYTTIEATELIGTPNVNVKCQAKVGIFYNSGASMDITVHRINTEVFAIFGRAEPGTTRVTWKQTNDNASMIANISAYTN